MKRELFRSMNAWSQLFFFCASAFVGYIFAILLTSIISLFLFQGVALAEIMQSPSFLRLSQTIAAVCVFLLPSFIYAYLFHDGGIKYFSSDKHISFTIALSVIVLMIVVQPAVNIIGHYNQQMILPDFMASVEEWMRGKEKSTEEILNLCFRDKGVGSFIANLLVIAVLAGIVEEFFFRGCLQKIIEKIVVNKHAAVWIAAFIFSAIHLQFYGFFPRLLLGALLGYLFVWSGSIWLPVLAHVLNNALVVVFTHIYIDTPQYNDFQNIGVGNSILGVLSVTISLIVMSFIYKITQRGRNRELV